MAIEYKSAFFRHQAGNLGVKLWLERFQHGIERPCRGSQPWRWFIDGDCQFGQFIGFGETRTYDATSNDQPHRMTKDKQRPTACEAGMREKPPRTGQCHV